MVKDPEWKIKTESELRRTSRPNLEGKTVKAMEEAGWRAERVSYFDARTQRSHDLLGFGDVICWGGNETVIIQVCARSSHAARKRKILTTPRAHQWIEGSRTRHIWLALWDKPEGKWRMDIRILTEKDFICHSQDASTLDALTVVSPVLHTAKTTNQQQRKSTISESTPRALVRDFTIRKHGATSD